MYKLRNYVIATLIAMAGLWFAGMASQAAACGQTATVACGLTAPEKHFSGNVKIQKPIKVTVCHSYWNQLKVGHLNGRATRWWGPTIRKGGWSADLPAAASECKSWWVKPGTSIDTFASCVQRVISTGPMTRSKIYWLN